MRTLVPFDAVEPKTRLAPVLDDRERRAFARVMLDQVLETLSACGRSPTVLSNASIDVDVPVTVDERTLTAAVNDALRETEGETTVVMADLVLATPAALESLFEPTAEVVLVPGRGGGTNAFRSRHPEFRVDYHGASIRDHQAIVEEIGATVATVDSFRLSTDVDEPVDLAELLLHGDGPAAEWLRDRGFELAIEDGRVGVRRE